MKHLLAVAFAVLAGCGGGGGSSESKPFVAPPPVVVEPPFVVVPPIVVPPVVVPPVVIEPPPAVPTQMSYPGECLTVASATGLADYPYVTCDGIPTSGDVSYPYDSASTETALIEVYVVVDTELDTKGLTVEEFVLAQFDFANDIYVESGVFIELQVAGIEMVEVTDGDLIQKFRVFTTGSREFRGLDQGDADFAFLFKRRADVPRFCGVASLTVDRSETVYRRGISQCHVGEEFTDTATTRYYERASITFIHEMGHLMGLEHNIESATTIPLFPFSYGYLLPEYEDDKSVEWNGYGSVMSYSDKPTHKNSDPDASFEIPELGIVVPVGSSKADAVSHLNRVRYYMSQLGENNES